MEELGHFPMEDALGEAAPTGARRLIADLEPTFRDVAGISATGAAE